MKPGYKLDINIPDSKFIKYLAIFNYESLNTIAQLCLVENSSILKYKKDNDFLGIWKLKNLKK